MAALDLLNTYLRQADGQNPPPDVDPDATGSDSTVASPAAFAAQFGPAAARAGARLGVDPAILLGQWGLETGWGKSVIPGTNNLGNIKDFSGGGVAARDNQTGSTDRYRQFASADDFANHYVDLIARKYPGAINSGSDAARFALGLQAGGYAEDPNYAAKVQASARAVAGLRGASAAAQPSQPAPADPYAAILAAGLAAKQPVPPGEQDGNFVRGAKTAFKQLPQLGYGLLAGAGATAENLMGEGGIATGVKNAGLQGYQAWSDQIQKDSKPSDSFTYAYEQASKGDLGALGDWLAYSIGYAGGQGVQMLATAGLGSVVGKAGLKMAAEKLASGMVQKEAARIAATREGAQLGADALTKVATANVAAKLGQTAAIGASALGMEGGEIYGDLVSDAAKNNRTLSGEDLARAFGATLAAGGLEFVGDKLGVDIMLGRSPFFRNAPKMAGVKGRIARGALDAAASAPIEGGTEFGQTMIEEYGKGHDPLSADTMKQSIDAAAQGAVGGAAMGFAGGAVHGPQGEQQRPALTTPPRQTAPAAPPASPPTATAPGTRAMPPAPVLPPNAGTLERAKHAADMRAWQQEQTTRQVGAVPYEHVPVPPAPAPAAPELSLTPQDGNTVDFQSDVGMRGAVHRPPINPVQERGSPQYDNGIDFPMTPPVDPMADQNAEAAGLAEQERARQHEAMADIEAAQAAGAAEAQRTATEQQRQAERNAQDDLLNRAGRLGLQARDQAAAEQQAYLQAEREKRQAELDAIHDRLDARQAMQSRNARMDLLDQVLTERGEATAAGKLRAFSDRLRREGYRNIAPTPEEIEHATRHGDLATAFTQPDQVYAAPNELVDAVPERAPALAQQTKAKPADAPALPPDILPLAQQSKDATEFWKALNKAKVPTGQRAPLMEAFKAYVKNGRKAPPPPKVPQPPADAAWRDTPFAPRIQAMWDALHAAGAADMAHMVERGSHHDAKVGQLKEENTAFRESKARQTIAALADAGKPVQPLELDPIDAAQLEAMTDVGGTLPRPIIDAAVTKWNELAAKLGALGFTYADYIQSTRPLAARQAFNNLNHVLQVLNSLAARRYQEARQQQNRNPERLEQSEDWASEVLGIDTRAYPGVDASRQITLGRGQIQPGSRLKQKRSNVAAPAVAPEPTAGITPEPTAEPEDKGTVADDLAGQQINKEWVEFTPESGSLGIPRADMPQIKAEHRGALTQFLLGRGIAHEQDIVEPDTLKPTQREFSPAKVQQARDYQGGDRAILVSSDDHVLDGHHQWLAKMDEGMPVRVIRFDAPIAELLPLAKEFPSAEVADGATPAAPSQIAAPEKSGKSQLRHGPGSFNVPDVPASPAPGNVTAEGWWESRMPAERIAALDSPDVGMKAWGELSDKQKAVIEKRIADAFAKANEPAEKVPEVAPRKPVEESDQDRTHREWGENYNRVANTDDLSTVSTVDLERAEAYAQRKRTSELRKGWDGGEVNQHLVRSVQVEEDRIRAELKKRRQAAEPQPAPASAVHQAAPRSTSEAVNEFIDGKRDVPPTTEEVAAEQAAAKPEQPAIDPLDAELQAALGHLGDVLGDVFGGKLNATGQQHTAGDLLPALSKVVELLIRKGFRSFSAAIGASAKAMRGNPAVAPHVSKISARQWKAAYNAIAEYHEGTDSEEQVASMPADQVLRAVAAPAAPSADTAAMLDQQIAANEAKIADLKRKQEQAVSNGNAWVYNDAIAGLEATLAEYRAARARQEPAKVSLKSAATGDVLHAEDGTLYRLEGIDIGKNKIRMTRNPDMLSEQVVLMDQDRYNRLVEEDAAVRGAHAGPDIVANELVTPEPPQVDERENARALAALAANAGNPVGVDGQFAPGVYGTPDQPLQFVSGMSRPGDFTRLFAGGKNVGISVLELSRASIPKIAEQLANTPGAYLFVDSGAFTTFMRNIREAAAAEREQREAAEAAALDHDAVLARYEDLSHAISKASAGMAMGRAFFVMPDIVGDQAGSLDLVAKYAEEINFYGLQAIIPLQGGELTLTEAYETMMRNLGLDPHGHSPIIGIPSQAEAVSNQELTDLLRKYGDSIDGVHILGAVSEQRLQPRLDAINAAGYDGNVSADANRLRALINENRPRKQAFKHLMQSNMADGGPEPRIVRDDQRPEPREPLSELGQRARNAETVEPEAITEHELTTQQLNRLSVKDMTDAQLLRAQKELPKRADPIAKEIERRGLDKPQPPDTTNNANVAAPGVMHPNATAPEHVQTGVDDRELHQIVREFNSAHAEMMDGEHVVSNVFQPPAKSDIVRLDKKAGVTSKNVNGAKVYHREAGWMTPDEARAHVEQWRQHAQQQGDDHATRSANSQRVVLSLFDLSGEWSKPWEEAGYQVYRFDIQDDPEMGDVNNFSTEFFTDWFGSFEGMDVYAILAACPCTDFAVSGAKHFAAKDADGRTIASVKLVHQTLKTIEYFKPAVWALENPVGRIEELGGLPPWRLSFDPYLLGDPYTKKTLIWGRFNADLPIAPVEPTEGSKMFKQYGGKSMATKNARSVTPEGFSYGFFMANNAIDHPAMAIHGKYDRLDRSLIDQAVAAGVTEDEIDHAVEDPYYQDLDDDAAHDAIRELIAEKQASEGDDATLTAEQVGQMLKEAGDNAPKMAEQLRGAHPHLADAVHDVMTNQLGYADWKGRYTKAGYALRHQAEQREMAAQLKELGGAEVGDTLTFIGEPPYDFMADHPYKILGLRATRYGQKIMGHIVMQRPEKDPFSLRDTLEYGIKQLQNYYYGNRGIRWTVNGASEPFVPPVPAVKQFKIQPNGMSLAQEDLLANSADDKLAEDDVKMEKNGKFVPFEAAMELVRQGIASGELHPALPSVMLGLGVDVDSAMRLVAKAREEASPEQAAPATAPASDQQAGEDLDDAMAERELTTQELNRMSVKHMSADQLRRALKELPKRAAPIMQEMQRRGISAEPGSVASATEGAPAYEVRLIDMTGTPGNYEAVVSDGTRTATGFGMTKAAAEQDARNTLERKAPTGPRVIVNVLNMKQEAIKQAGLEIVDEKDGEIQIKLPGNDHINANLVQEGQDQWRVSNRRFGESSAMSFVDAVDWAKKQMEKVAAADAKVDQAPPTTEATETDDRPALMAELRQRLGALSDRALDAGDGNLAGRIRGFTVGMSDRDSILTREWVDQVVAEREKMVRRVEKANQPAAAGKPAASKSDRTLRQDWGVEFIDGYTPIPGGKNEQTDFGLRGGVKDAFLKDATSYLKDVAKALEAFGFVPHLDRKGKPDKTVSVNEGGPAVPGDVTLTMQNHGAGRGIYIQVGGNPVGGVSSPSGVTVMLRDTKPGDRYSGGANQWVPANLTASALAERAAKAVAQAAGVPFDTMAASNNEQDQPRSTENDDNGQPRVAQGDTERVPAPDQQRRDDPQPGSAPAHPGDVEAGQPGNVVRPATDGDSGRAGVRPAATHVGSAEGADQHRDAGDGRTRNGGTRNPDAGTGGNGAGSRAAVDPSPVVKDPATVSPANTGPGDFHIADPLRIVGGGQVARFDKNRAALELRNQLLDAGRAPTREEQEVLAGYTGWGSFGQELFQGTWQRPAPKAGWEQRDAWLRNNLGQAEWEGMQRSIINAHYTDPPTVMAMWDMVRRMGFTGGRVLEPSIGIGNFFGMMPLELASRSQRAGIELDPVTGSMAQLLYPNANIQIKGYEQSKTPDNFYDLVIGNWPFADISPADRRYNRLSPLLHDYFFLKALDQTRPGGIVIGITSKGTMDKKDLSVRAEMARKGELVAAFRLPSGAFEEYAGTKVVTDIIILRKRAEPAGIVANDGWIQSLPHPTPEGTEIDINEYYHTHPDHVIGTIDFGHGTTTFRAGLVVHRPDNMLDHLRRIVDLVPEGAYHTDTRGKQISYVANHTGDRTGALTKTNGGLFIVQGEYLAPAHEVAKYAVKDDKATARRVAQLEALIDMRRLYGTLIEAERKGDASAERAALRNAYEAFKQQHRGYSDSFGLDYLRKIDDPFYPALAALEVNVDNGDGTYSQRPAAILNESTIRGARKMVNPTITDAFVLARNESVNPSPAQIAALAGVDEATVRRELIEAGAAFETPAGDFIPSDMYLSGNVREKLRQARAGLEEGNAAMQRNIDALTKVLPADIPYYKIETQMGATWVPPARYAEYIAHMLGLPDTENIDVQFQAGGWKVNFPAAFNHRAEASSGFGTGHVAFKRLVRAAIANQTINVKKKDSDGNEYIDDEATKEANGKISDMRLKFGEWLWAEPVRRVELEREYNEVRNAYATPHFDGSFLGFQGMALSLGRGPFNLREHQVNAIWRALVTRKSLNAHEVGTGKTFTMGGIAVESRRYGIAKKPLLFAHNANSKSVASEIQMMYPAAKVLYISTLDKDSIKVRMAQMTNDDWDVIVLPHSLLDRIGFKEETLMAMAQDDINDLEIAAKDAAQEDGVEIKEGMWDDEDELKKLRSPTAKQLVKQRMKILETIRKLSQQASREDSVAFEDMGVDMVLVDEAHEFKKPPIATKMKMKGLQTQTSNRSIAMSFITKYVRGMNNGGNVHLFTGTPITNTMTEVFHMMRYMMNEEMKESGLADWDGWFGSFAREVNDVELSSTGEYEAVTRLQAFINVPELRRMIGQYMDVVFADDMPEMRPRAVNGKTMADKTLTDDERAELLDGRTENAQDRPYKKVVNQSSDMSPEQVAVFQQVQGLARAWRAMTKKARKEAMSEGAPEVPIIHDAIAEKASFDVRLVNAIDNAGLEGTPEMEPHPASKPARVVKNLIDIYRSSPDANQVVFMEQGMHKTVTRSEGPKGMKRPVTYPAFSTMHDMVERLVQAGIPREQIATVTGSTSKDKRKEIADAMNSGKIRIVFGSTDSLGVGVNMQRNLRAMHHMDAPWMPGELEQRNGRGHRQGNQWNTVLEYRYLTDRLDGRRWQVLAIKQRFITEFMKSKGDVRVIEGDAASDEQSDLVSTFADAAGDPRVLVREKLKKKLEQLQSRERLHTQAQADAAGMIRRLREKIERDRRKLPDLQQAAQQAAALLDQQRGETFRMTLDGKLFDKRSEAADFISQKLPSMLRKGNDVEVGQYGGLPLYARWSNWSDKPDLYLAVGNQTVESNGPSLPSLESQLRWLRDEEVRRIESEIADDERALGHNETVMREPFHLGDKLEAVRKQLEDLERDIAMNPVAPPYWLRTGAPIDTTVYWQGKPFVVTGHRWSNDGWFVLAADEHGDVVIPYMQAEDAQGMPLYEEREFEPPQVQGGAQANAQASAPVLAAGSDYRIMSGNEYEDFVGLPVRDELRDRFLVVNVGGKSYAGVPDNGFASRAQAQAWVNQQLGIEQSTEGAARPAALRKADGSYVRQDPVPDAMYSRAVDPTRRRLLMAAAAAAVTPGAQAGDVAIGKARPIDPKILAQRVAPGVEKVLRDGHASGTTSLNGTKVLRQAMNLIALTGPKELRALAAQVEKLLPTTGNLMLTVDDTRRMNVHGVVSLAPVLHMQLFTAEGRKGLTYETVIHEAMHVAVAARYRSLSVGVVRSNDKLLGLSAPAAAKALEQFQAVWEEFRSMTAGEKFANADLALAVEEARGDPDEFFVRALTDPILQAYMAGKRYEGKTLWERFKDWVKRSLFGIGPESGTAPSWLDAALVASGDVADAMGRDSADFARMKAISNYREQKQNSRMAAPDMIDVDGVQRPITNSKGNPIAATDEAIRAFWRWFGNSMAVDDLGRPLILFHGTQSAGEHGNGIERFKPSGPRKMIFLTDDPAEASGHAEGTIVARYALGKKGASEPAPNVMPVYLKADGIVDMRPEARLPGIPGVSLYESPRVGAFGRGKTEAYIERPFGYTGRHFVVPKGSQIKSAIGNSGDFDPANPDIMASRALPATETQGGHSLGAALASAFNNVKNVELPAGYLVGDLLSHSGKVSWWHKTIGTMDNLARRYPAFNTVYRAVQAFIGDVSKYAMSAAELAPRLLPQIDTWADINPFGQNRKQAVSAVDTKAIAAPIFEGTLMWSRDEHGRPVLIDDLRERADAMTPDQKAQVLLQKGVIDNQQYKAWRALPIDTHDAAVENRFEATQLAPGIVWTDKELRDKYNLTPEQIALYREFRSAVDKSITNLTISEMAKMGGDGGKDLIDRAVAAPDLQSAAAMMRDHYVALAKMHPDLADMHLATAKQIMNQADKGQTLMDRGYAPLMRFGKYTVYVTTKDEHGQPEQAYFGMFESQMDANKMARDMQEQYKDDPNAKIEQGTVSDEEYKMFAGVSPETVELFGSMLGLGADANESDRAYQEYLRLAKANRSALKRLIHRKGIKGFSEDAGRVLASFLVSNARLTSSNVHTGEIDKAVVDIPKGQGELKDEAMRLRQHVRDPQSGGTFLSGMMFAQFLGGSVASAMVNMTQPFAITLPYLSQWGGIGSAAKRIGQAIRDARKDSTGDAELDKAMEEHADKIAPQEIHFLMSQGAGKATLRAGDGTKGGDARAMAHNTMAAVRLGWGRLFAMAELSNRKITFIAAYRTAREQGLPNPGKFAADAVDQTQFVYNQGNRPRWARNPIGGLLYTFKQYSVGYLELLSRMAFAGKPGSPERAAGRRAALYMVAVLFMLGGADGLPFEQDLEDAIDGLLQRLGYNFSTRRAKQAFLARTLGEGGADFMLKGASALPGMPVDVAGRLGMGNLIPGTGLLKKKPSYTADVGELAGPAGDLAKRAFSASGKALGGDIAGAALDISPLAVRNAAKGVDMLRTGTYRDARGYKINDTSPLEGAMKIVGFQPNSTANVQDAKGQALDMISQARMRSQEIAEHWAQGRANRDEDMVNEARAMRDDWNRKNPETKVRINMPAIMHRVRAIREDALQRTQQTAGKALKAAVRNELSQVRE
jgi:N12 class adenine-specific DNA methylase